MFWRLSSLSEKRSIALRSLALAAALLALPSTGLASADGPRINEFMAANDDIRDEDADTSDWLEIYNPTAEIAISEAGFSPINLATSLSGLFQTSRFHRTNASLSGHQERIEPISRVPYTPTSGSRNRAGLWRW
jgi:hypothetical protein